jgi:hypothetical protein
MTKEQFDEIIQPIYLLDEKTRRFLIAAIDKNFQEHERLCGFNTCDGCKCHPTVIHSTTTGRFCENCKPK